MSPGRARDDNSVALPGLFYFTNFYQGFASLIPGYCLPPLIVRPHLLSRCGFSQQYRECDYCCSKLKKGANAAMVSRELFKHAPSHYEFVAPAIRWLPGDFRVERYALVRQRILRCRPHRGLYYKGFAGLKPACFNLKRR